MKNNFLLCLILASFQGFAQNYPEAKKIPTTFKKHQFTYQDDYSWMEKIRSTEVNTWVEAENQITYNHLELVKKKYSTASKMKEYDFLSTNGLPSKRGEYFYTRYILDKNKPPVLFYRKAIDDDPIEIIDPYKIYKDNNVRLTNFYPSKNSRLIAFKISKDGGDQEEVRFVDIEKKKTLDDVLTKIKFSGVSWNQEKGVFYKKNSNVNTFEKDSTYLLYYHKIGDLQTNDKLIYDTTASESNFQFFTAEDKLIVVETNKEETERKYFYANLSDETFSLNHFALNHQNGFDFHTIKNGKVYFSTSKSDFGEVNYFDLNNEANDVKIIPQIYNSLLVDTRFLNDYIICKYKTTAKNYMHIYDYDGKFIRKFEAPFGMDFSIKFLDSKKKELYVTFYSYVISYLNYKLNIETGKYGPYFNSFIEPKPSLFTFDHFETKIVSYKSRDNKDVPITIIHKKGILLDGNNPTLLEAYGGFGAVYGANFDTGLLTFIEKGGVYAYAEIRGGGEKGQKWHADGMGLKKINTFNDFIDGAEYLINENYTNPKKLAITGASQGGLLVGVAMTKRPELFKVAIPKFGVFDMAKFNQFTVGKYHNDEYGNPEIENEFNSLIEYSPYHNIKEDVNYPITMIITSENDDRVPPLHSYKFAAKLQNRSAQKNPIYLKTLKNSGHHGKNANYKDQIKEDSEFYNFLLYHLNE